MQPFPTTKDAIKHVLISIAVATISGALVALCQALLHWLQGVSPETITALVGGGKYLHSVAKHSEEFYG